MPGFKIVMPSVQIVMPGVQIVMPGLTGHPHVTIHTLFQEKCVDVYIAM